jgi:hypothetical protein
VLCELRGESSSRLAVPSCIFPAGAAENCERLAPYFPEVGLYLLELAPCLAYGEKDLPAPRKGLRHHVHLPLDLPWERGPEAAFEAVMRLCEKTARLAPWGFALHPPHGMSPQAGAEALASFAARWRAAGLSTRDILLENVENAGAETLWPVARDLDFSLCLDLGHMLAYVQEDILALPGVFPRTRMLHIYAPYDFENPLDRNLPGKGHRHRALSALDETGRKILKTMLENVSRETVIVHEVFSEAALAAGAPALERMCADWGIEL